jgi:hypothetical protein
MNLFQIDRPFHRRKERLSSSPARLESRNWNWLWSSPLRKLSLLFLFIILLAWAVSAGQPGKSSKAKPEPAAVVKPSTPHDADPPKAAEPLRSVTGRRGIYLTAATVADPQQIDDLLAHLIRANFNAVVIDMKEMGGHVVYESHISLAETIGARTLTLPLKALLDRFHRAGIYVIARQVVCYDPLLASYLKSAQVPWVSPLDARVVQYNLAIARELAASGFDEIQFDYIRFADGALGDTYEQRYQAIDRFLALARQQVGGLVHLSADIFGRTLWDWNLKKIDPIGQSPEEISRYVDLISPMVYPSHYETDYFRDHPYETIHQSLSNGLRRHLAMRPYLQAFDLRLPSDMTLVEYIRAELRAVHELGFDSYLFWNPSSDYEALWRALGIP